MGSGDREATTAWFKRLVGASKCCGTCFGGVLADHDAQVRAEAWDEGYHIGAGEARGEDATANPYRAAEDMP